MFPYLAMLALPGSLALTGTKRAGALLLLVAAVYWVMIGFRFHVGMDWFNYIGLYRYEQRIRWENIPAQREPAFVLLNRVAGAIRGGPILVNVISALVFTGGLYAAARRCREPMLGFVVATPLLVVGLAMSGIRQAMGLGVIFFLFAVWEKCSTLTRCALVLLASLFHFSAIFFLIYGAIGSKAQPVLKVAGVLLVGAAVFIVSSYKLEAVQAYSKLYIGGESKLSAPGALVQIAPIAAAGLLYLLVRRAWMQANEEHPLFEPIAWSAVLMLPLAALSSVGAYRFSLYFWAFAMAIWAGVPGLIGSGAGRLFYRIVVVAIAFAMLIGWLMFANNSFAWLPYKSWLLQPPGVSIWRHGH